MPNKIDTDNANSKALSNITNPPSKAIGNTLSDLFNLIFGYPIHEKSEISRLKHQKNIEEFQTRLNKNISSIPEEHRIPPKESIVGPALEASKYYFDAEEIRKMFEKLITNSMDDRKVSKVHPSFTEIIKQMSPLDAQNLKLFNDTAQLPIAQFITLRDNTNDYILNATNVFISNQSCQDIDLQAVSISSLSRIGLLEIKYGAHISNESLYEPFLSLPLYTELKSQVKIINSLIDQKIIDDKKITLSCYKGLVMPTPLGKAFISVCLSPLPKKSNP